MDNFKQSVSKIVQPLPAEQLKSIFDLLLKSSELQNTTLLDHIKVLHEQYKKNHKDNMLGTILESDYKRTEAEICCKLHVTLLEIVYGVKL